MKELLHAYKFGGRKYLAHFFVKLMTRFAKNYLNTADHDAVLPIPLDAEKRRERGFNQSELISAALSRSLGLPHLSGGLRRMKSFSSQSLLPKEDRRSNIAGCFSVNEGFAVKNKRLLLVDDILTTGYTASEAARALKEAGAGAVTVLACARGI
ncbi:MAG: ComF family protein [Candidatus Omnitrophota bacterium]